MESPTSRRRCSQEHRRRLVLQYRIQGLSQRQIAEKFGCHQTTISDDLKVAFEAYRKECDAERVEYVRLDLARLDYMLSRLWPGIEEGDAKSVAVALRILERRSRLLGLDQPVRQQVETAPVPTAGELEERLRSLLAEVD